MGSHPLNLGLRFILELIVLASSMHWVWNNYFDLKRNLLIVIVPASIAVTWACFAVPNDPSRSGNTVIAINGLLRLALEASVFTLGVWFLYQSGWAKSSLFFAFIVMVHYMTSYDRVTWLIKQ